MIEADSEETKPADIRKIYYDILTGGAKAKLLESIVTTRLFDLFNNPAPVSESTIVRNLNLHELRAKKWLFQLVQHDFLEKQDLEEPHYVLSKSSKLIHTNVDNIWLNCAELIETWRSVAYEDLSLVLKGDEPRFTFIWPPQTAENAQALETWMSDTSYPVLKVLTKTIEEIPKNFSKILDVGCGDATITCALANYYKMIEFVAYNLPLSLELAERKIAKQNLSSRITTVAGDFTKDTALPSGADCIIFSRVLCNYSPEVCKKVIKMAYDALPEEGYILICEGFRDFNQSLIAALEYRYIFWDSYEANLFNTTEEYKKILKSIGFKPSQVLTYPNNIHSVLIAHK